MELTLASQNTGCRFVFAMLESDYGLDTSPDRINGWLSILMSGHTTSPVLRLWLSSHVESTASAIAEFLGEHTARRDALAGVAEHRRIYDSSATVIVPMEASLLGISDEEVTKLNTAWEIIQTTTNSIDSAALSSYLDSIGVYDALDLRQCDEGDITEITKLLKKIQRKVFSTCLSSFRRER